MSTELAVSIPEREVEVARLIEYFNAASDGSTITWGQIARETGIPMNKTGRDQVRRALRRMRRPYAAVRGAGIELSSAGNTLAIMRGRFVRIDRAVRKADATRGQLAARHFEQLEARDKNSMLMLAGFFGAVRTIAKQAVQHALPAKVEPKKLEPKT